MLKSTSMTRIHPPGPGQPGLHSGYKTTWRNIMMNMEKNGTKTPTVIDLRKQPQETFWQ